MTVTAKMRKKTKNGFVLPLAVIIVSAVLVVSITVSTLIIGELEFSSFGKDSQKAFFAADAGAECAMYWDGSPRTAFESSPSSPISCANIANQPITETSPGIFNFRLDFVDGSCVYVNIDKSAPATVIRSRGRNSCSTTDIRRVERALKVTI